ncbi:MAG: chemotaxis protein CheW [Clostridiaceae bacterium]
MDSVEMKVLIFEIKDELYATDITEVERILSYEKTTEIPDSPSYVEGVLNYEGNILPVISISKKFNVDSKEVSDNTKIIVTKQGDKKYGFIVDLVCEVKDVNSSSIEDAPEIISGIANRYIRGFIKLKDKIIIYLDLKSILSEEEKLNL